MKFFVGKDLHWYNRDKKSRAADAEAIKEEIQRVKEEEEQAMREALGLAPKRTNRSQSNRLDKHELSELMKRGSTAEDLGAGHAEAARVHGLGFSREAHAWEEPSTLPEIARAKSPEMVIPGSSTRSDEEASGEESHRKKKRRDEKKRERHDKREKRHSRDSDDRKRHKKDKEKRRHDSD